ncbi:MAG TPA: hydantoinase/oxoprolinase family protein [Methanospirillum sp.]|uniref:hydantoinase/oxoprolinase family protein n=1 Tax=Methanospirillum sp. TaxID=45200 RepID=UPI002C14AE91|nr:hydantoinase/oxoprolinase family protein [Methanospirillum sp.]HWQ65014.1 hydantoinase/oxoprolinase family protein [Methanospirillum sp.]
MFTGIDIGGTNTDIALVDGDIQTIKVSNSKGLELALEAAGRDGRLAISTSQPLNAMVTGNIGRIRTITIPGPGLMYGGAVKGAVGPRGDILEPVDTEEIERLLRGCRADGIAIVGKFSVRNPIQEEIVRDIARLFFDDEQIATSAPLGGLNFPARITTTRINAGIKAKVAALSKKIRTTHPDSLFVTSDGGLCGHDRAIENPSLLYHSSPATVAIGAGYLSHKKNCLVVDIGGTTTDLVPIKEGKPIFETLFVQGKRTLVQAVSAETVPLGGDSCIRDELMQFRSGNARAFGGTEPTLTDALNVLGADIGDTSRSCCLDPKKAEDAYRKYLEKLGAIIHQMDPIMIVGAGFLAPYLIPDLANEARVRFFVPDHAGSANAVGAAVSRISIKIHAHADSQRGVLTLNGIEHPLPTGMSDEELLTHTGELVRAMAKSEGAPPKDLHELVTSQYSAYNVVRGGRIQARITDFVIGIAPGITCEAP